MLYWRSLDRQFCNGNLCDRDAWDELSVQLCRPHVLADVRRLTYFELGHAIANPKDMSKLACKLTFMAWLIGAAAANAASVEEAEFKAKDYPMLISQGWRYLISADAGGGPVSDVFIQDIRKRDRQIRSVWVLIANYFDPAPPWGSIAFPRSTKELYWVDCADGGYQYRQGANYTKVDGSGLALNESALPTSETAQFKQAAPGTLLGEIVTAACSPRFQKP